MTTATKPTIPTQPERRDAHHFSSEAVVIIEGSSRSGGPGGWGVFGWDESGAGRLVFEGPLVPGPHAGFFGLASFMDNRGGMSREYAEKEAAGLLFRVAAGDVLTIAAVDYQVSVDKRGYPKLTRIQS